MASIIELLKNKDYDEDIFNELNIEYVTDEIILSAAEKTLNLLKIRKKSLLLCLFIMQALLLW